MRWRVSAPLEFVLVLIVVLVGAPLAGASTATIGETTLTPHNGTLDALSPAGAPVFQGDASGNYVLSAAASGTITSWRFLSAGATRQSHFQLRVLRPVGTSGTAWKAVATSASAQVASSTGVDAVNGPFAVSIPVQAGDRIALQPVDNGSTPIEQGTANADGVRFFSAPFSNGSTSTVSNASLADNGQVVPIQATVSYSPQTLTVTRTGSGTGSVTGDVNPAISCPGTCSRQYPEGTTVTLREKPASGSKFAGWSGGGCTGTSSTCAVVLTARTTVTATFNRVPLANTSPPTISGPGGEEQPLSCQPGVWTAPDATFSFAWYWSAQDTLGKFTLRRGEKVVGVKRPASKINPPPRFLQKFTQFSTARTITVPGLVSPTSFYCTVTARTPVPESVTASSATLRVKPDPPALARDRRTARFHPPHIQPGVGVGGYNRCQPGLWTGRPKLAYAWYAILKGRQNP